MATTAMNHTSAAMPNGEPSAAPPHNLTPAPFPARTRSAVAKIRDIETVAISISFADKILITISQSGRLAHWVHVPLAISIPEAPLISDFADEDEEDMPRSDLLPLSHLTATTTLGSRGSARDTFVQLLATQVASAMKTRDPDEERLVVLGVGLERGIEEGVAGSQVFGDLVELCLGVI